jgi:hypothetical protein
MLLNDLKIAITAFILIIAALATIGVQTLRSATANPIEGLREE